LPDGEGKRLRCHAAFDDVSRELLLSAGRGFPYSESGVLLRMGPTVVGLEQEMTGNRVQLSALSIDAGGSNSGAPLRTDIPAIAAVHLITIQILT
jgi:hypothetical protein